jgi:hypothetical protein
MQFSVSLHGGKMRESPPHFRSTLSGVQIRTEGLLLRTLAPSAANLGTMHGGWVGRGGGVNGTLLCVAERLKFF